MSESDQSRKSSHPMYKDLCPTHQLIVDVYVERFRAYFENAPRMALVYATIALDIVCQERVDELSKPE